MQSHSKTKQLFLLSGALLTWFAVVLQGYLIMANRVTSVPETVARFFSFYTVLTNILVALYFTYMLLAPAARPGRFFSGSATAIAVYISVVGIVYNLVLRNLWNPAGYQQLADELLHVVVPLFFIIYWFAFARTRALQWKYMFSWLMYPLFYLLVILLRGSWSGFYPYPFIDVTRIGYSKALVNSAAMLGLFLAVSALFIFVGKSASNKTSA
ncbi:MAG: hypothetical protein JWQ27_3109 [Ferruginibacter sp.]|nr:hypothetical protein [Ferruginibacter sp.]